MSIPYPTKDKSFLGLAVVEIVNPDVTNSPDEPTLAQWAGFKVGDRLTVECYSDGEKWAQVGHYYHTEEFGQVLPTDWFELNEGEYKVIEE